MFVGLGVWICFKWYYGIVFGLMAGLKGSRSIYTEDIQRVNFANLFRPKKWASGLKQGITFGLVACLIFSLSGISLGSLAAGAALGLFIGIKEILREVSYFVEVDTPYQRLKSGFMGKVLMLALVCLLINEFSNFVSYNDLFLNDIWYLFAILVGGGTIGLSNTPLFRHCILRLCLYFEGAMPLKYATFLDYAASARILEKDGGHWRFRHQKLQEHFANLE
jgi:hypothetical protein